MDIKVCIGSSCHLKGSETVVEMFEKAIKENDLEGKINLAGSFCLGNCNRDGVTVQVDGETHTGVTPESFNVFFTTAVMPKLLGK